MSKLIKTYKYISLIIVVVIILAVVAVPKLKYNGPIVYSQEKLAINYVEDLSQIQLSAQDIHMLDSDEKKVDITLSFWGDSKKIVIINPPKDGYKAGSKYTLYINSKVSFNLDDRASTEKTWSFKTEKDKDINFQDKNLETAIRRQINKPLGNIYYGEVYKLKSLYAENYSIERLEGIKNLTSLEILSLSDNKISNIKELESLKKLEVLALVNNQVTDITSLKTLKTLKTLWLSGNKVSDYKPTKAYYNNLKAKDFELN